MIRYCFILLGILSFWGSVGNARVGENTAGGRNLKDHKEVEVEMIAYFPGGPYFGNMIPPRTYYIAAESKVIAEEYEFLYMSPQELNAELAVNNQGTFLGEAAMRVQELVEFRAHALCAHHGDSMTPPKNLYAETFKLEYVQADSFPLGRSFRIELPRETVAVTEVPRVKWRFSFHGRNKLASESQGSLLLGPDAIFVPHRGVSISTLMEANRTFFMSAGAGVFEYAPHLVFSELYCQETKGSLRF